MSDKIRTVLDLRLCDNDDDWTPLTDYLRWQVDYPALDEHSKVMMQVSASTSSQDWSEWDSANNLVVRNLDQTNALNVRVYTTLQAGEIAIQVPPGDFIKITDWDSSHVVEFTSAIGIVSYLAMVW